MTVGGSASGPGRCCADCGNPLSRYNPGNHCQACLSSGRKDNDGQTAETLAIGKRLAGIRRERGLTQEQVAERAGVSAVTIQKLEREERHSARLATLSALAEVLGVPITALLGHDSAETSTQDQQPVRAGNFAPIRIPDDAWRTSESMRALRSRDFAAIFQLAHKHGVSQTRIVICTGMAQSHVSLIMRGKIKVTSLERVEAIADGFNMPDFARVMLGLAPCGNDQTSASPIVGERFPVRESEAVAQARRTLGRRLAAFRHAAGHSQAEFSVLANYSRSTIANVETGYQRVPRSFWEKADSVLGAEGSLIKANDKIEVAVKSERGEAARQATPNLPAVCESGAESQTRLGQRGDESADSIAVRSSQGRRVIQALDVIGNDRLGEVADSLGDLVGHYALTICALPPADVYDELLSVRAYASGMIERAGLAQRRKDLIVVTGWLSNLLAVAACDMGEHAAARVWCSDAERRSQDARHPELAGWAVLTRAMIAFYQGQPRQSVSLAIQGRKIVPMGTVIHAKLAAQEMRAAAMNGDAASMAHARSYAAKAIAKLPSDAKVTGAFSINLGEDPPYTATSLLFVGNFSEAVSATKRVIQTVYHPETRQRGENPSGYARSLLILALAQAGVGRLDEAVAAGHTALAGSRPAWPTMVLAGKLDQILSRDYGGTRESAEYRDRYLETAGQPTGYHLQLPAPTEDR